MPDKLPCDSCKDFNTRKCLSCSIIEDALPKSLQKCSVDDRGRQVAPGDLERHGMIRFDLEKDCDDGDSWTREIPSDHAMKSPWMNGDELSPALGAMSRLGFEKLNQLKEKTLAVLTIPERAVMELYLDIGGDFIEIAARLGKSKSTVRTQFSEGLERIRKHFSNGDVADEGLEIEEIFFHATRTERPAIKDKYGQPVSDTRSKCGNGKKRNKRSK